MSESSEVAKNIFRTLANVMNPQVNWEFTIVELCLNKKIIYEGTKQVFKKIRDATTNIQGLKKDKKFIITVANSLIFYEASELHHLCTEFKNLSKMSHPPLKVQNGDFLTAFQTLCISRSLMTFVFKFLSFLTMVLLEWWCDKTRVPNSICFGVLWQWWPRREWRIKEPTIEKPEVFMDFRWQCDNINPL